jgi:REP element-mobilizing transposase RayT
MRKLQLVNGEYYHVFNRGVEKRDIFTNEEDYRRFFLSLTLMNDEKEGLMIQWRNFKMSHPDSSVEEFLRLSLSEKKKLVNFIAYCLNANHFHFILQQKSDRGIEKLMHRIATGYTMYFNERYHRSGSLFQGSFKAVHIESNNFLRMSVYVNCNSEIHKIHSARDYKWCSFPEYLGKESNQLCKKKAILSQFKNFQEYLEYAVENIADFRERKQDEKLWLE